MYSNDELYYMIQNLQSKLEEKETEINLMRSYYNNELQDMQEKMKCMQEAIVYLMSKVEKDNEGTI